MAVRRPAPFRCRGDRRPRRDRRSGRNARRTVRALLPRPAPRLPGLHAGAGRVHGASRGPARRRFARDHERGRLAAARSAAGIDRGAFRSREPDRSESPPRPPAGRLGTTVSGLGRRLRPGPPPPLRRTRPRRGNPGRRWGLPRPARAFIRDAGRDPRLPGARRGPGRHVDGPGSDRRPPHGPPGARLLPGHEHGRRHRGGADRPRGRAPDRQRRRGRPRAPDLRPDRRWRSLGLASQT